MATKRPERTPQAGEKYIVRFPEGMRDAIAIAAKANGRSMNAEIVHRLSLSLEADVIRDEPPLAQEPPAGLKIDYETQVWAERISQPKNRTDLEQLLAVVRKILGDNGRLDEPKE